MAVNILIAHFSCKYGCIFAKKVIYFEGLTDGLTNSTVFSFNQVDINIFSTRVMYYQYSIIQ